MRRTVKYTINLVNFGPFRKIVDHSTAREDIILHN